MNYRSSLRASKTSPTNILTYQNVLHIAQSHTQTHSQTEVERKKSSEERVREKRLKYSWKPFLYEL